MALHIVAVRIGKSTSPRPSFIAFILFLSLTTAVLETYLFTLTCLQVKDELKKSESELQDSIASNRIATDNRIDKVS